MQKQQSLTDEESRHEGLGQWWVIPAVLFGSARLTEKLTNGTAWGRTSLALFVLGFAVMAAVAVVAVRRRDYGTLGWIAAGTVVAGLSAGVRGDLF